MNVQEKVIMFSKMRTIFCLTTRRFLLKRSFAEVSYPVDRLDKTWFLL